jgi:hypothetical protein
VKKRGIERALSMGLDDPERFVCVLQPGLGAARGNRHQGLEVKRTLLVDPVTALEPEL